MLKNNYLSVLQFQLRLKIKCDYYHDYIIVDDDYKKQMEICIDAMHKLKPDIVVFPEMTYQSDYDNVFEDYSKAGNLVVFGSTYIKNINHTMIFQNGQLIKIVKRFPCGSEPMVRFSDKITTSTFISDYLKEHEFFVKGNKVYVLNCLEYYESAYQISRNFDLSNELFGFIVPCSNSNPKVFMDESRALHNHNEYIYSFVCNRIKDDGSTRYGRSYIYGPIQYHEKDWLTEEGIISDEHNASILTLDINTPSYAYGKFAIGKKLSRFGRSDCYINTPKNIVVNNLF